MSKHAYNKTKRIPTVILTAKQRTSRVGRTGGGARAAADRRRGGAAAAARAGHVAGGGRAGGAEAPVGRCEAAARHQPVAERLPVSVL